MVKQSGQRLYRTETDEEQKRHTNIREQITKELPEICMRVRSKS